MVLTYVQLGMATVNSEQLCNLVSVCFVLNLGLFFFANRDKILGHVAHVHHAGSVLEHVILHLGIEAQNVKGFVGEHHVLLVVNGGHRELALGHVPVVKDVVGQQALRLQVGNLVRHQVLEGVSDNRSCVHILEPYIQIWSHFQVLASK